MFCKKNVFFLATLFLIGCADGLEVNSVALAADAGTVDTYNGVDTNTTDTGSKVDLVEVDSAPDMAQEADTQDVQKLPECVTENCDDGNQCTADYCQDGACKNSPYGQGMALCDDGDLCTNHDECVQGYCVGSDSKNYPNPCDDGNPCTLDECWNNQCTPHTPKTNGSNCTSANGCAIDKCQNGECVQEVPKGTILFTNEDNEFTCKPCVQDVDCKFESKTFCLSTPSSVSLVSKPVPMLEPTGKCVDYKCEFKETFCTDADVTTYDKCNSLYGVKYPAYKAGTCAHDKLEDTDLKFGFATKECWCTGPSTLECVEATNTNLNWEIGSGTFKNCPNGCDWNCM